MLVPDMLGMKKLQVKSEDIREIAAAARKLGTVCTDVTPAGVGIFAFSYAVGPAVLASLRPEVRCNITYIIGVGGYHSLPNVLRYVTTGFFREKGQWRFLNPNEYGKWLFVLSNLDRIADRHDRNTLRRIALSRIQEEVTDTNALAESLGGEGARIFAFVTNRNPEMTPKLIDSLPAPLRQEIARLDLANKDLSLLHARMILIHGLDDDIIPYPESVALAEALPPGHAELYLVRGLLHVDVQSGVVGKWTLWRATVAMLRARDGNQ